jgi:hypothetical protein
MKSTTHTISDIRDIDGAIDVVGMLEKILLEELSKPDKIKAKMIERKNKIKILINLLQ